MVKIIFRERADKFDERLKMGVMVLLSKKGDRNERNNYRGVCLLLMGSRVFAKRIRWWAENICVLDENQAGFRKGDRLRIRLK